MASCSMASRPPVQWVLMAMLVAADACASRRAEHAALGGGVTNLALGADLADHAGADPGGADAVHDLGDERVGQLGNRCSCT